MLIIEAIISLHLLQHRHLLDNLLGKALLLCGVENLDLDRVFFVFVNCNSFENFIPRDLLVFWHDDPRTQLVNFFFEDFTLLVISHVR